jgi:hypothetical protein
MLYRIGPNRWSTRPPDEEPRPRGPFIISDTMEPTEQVDGRFYTSKSKFRAVGRALGLTEVGNEKFKPKVRATDDRATKAARRVALKTALEKYRAGHRT